MDIRFAKISNHANNYLNPENSQVEMKGQKGVCCLANGINLSKTDGHSTPSKVIRILIESFMKRPALSADAMNAIFQLANNGVLVNQSPQYPSFVSAGAVFFLKNKYMYAVAGDNVIFHFVDGVLTEVFTGTSGNEPIYLGNTRYSAPKISEPTPFPKGENTFLVCSRSFADSFPENVLTQSLSRATHVTQKGKQRLAEVKCDIWLRSLWDNIGNMNPNIEYAAAALSLPNKKKKNKIILIAIIAALVLIIGFFVLGMFGNRRPPAPQQQPDQSMGDQLAPPGQGIPDVTGPNGETPPAPPTRPPQNGG